MPARILPVRPGQPNRAISEYRAGRRGPAAWWWIVAGALLAAPLPAGPTPANSGLSGGRLQVLLVLMPGQPAGSVLRTIPGRSRDQLSWALLNCTTPGPDAPHTSLAAVATGRRDALPAAGGELLLDGSPALRDLQARVKSAPSWRSAMSVGAFAAGRGKSVAYCSPPQGMGAGILTVLDPEGEPARGVRMISAPNLASALEEPPPADLVVMDLTSPAAGTAAAVISQRLSDWKPTPDRLVMLVWADPAARTGDTWTRLGLVGVLGLHGGPGLLTAGSTRTSGLVTVADLAPTLLEWLRLPVPAGAEGLPLRLASKEGRERLLRLADRAAWTQDHAVGLLVGWALTTLGVLLAILPLPGRTGRGSGARKAGKLLAALPLLGPPALLLTALDPVQVGTGTAVAVGGLAVTAVLVGLTTGSPAAASWMVTLGLILLDLIAGARMLSDNAMSNFPNIGARYYGMGNEFLGVTLAVALLLPFWAAEREWKSRHLLYLTNELPGVSLGLWTATAGLWLVTLVLVAHPARGADFGGALALAVAFFWGMRHFDAGGRASFPSRALLLKIALVGVLLAGVLVVLDGLRAPDQQSHLGRLATRLWTGDFSMVGAMLARKAALNFEMLGTPYGLAGVGVVAALGWLWYHEQGHVARVLLSRRPWVASSLECLGVGGLAALLLNDSGIVAAALAWGYGILRWVEVTLEE